MKLEQLYQVSLPENITIKEVSQLCGDINDQPNQPNLGVHIFLNSKMQSQTMQGIGGAFSELGGKALLSLDTDAQEQVAKDLFDHKFNYFRMAGGASDFGLDAYSLNDTDGDFSMEHFTLEREEKFLIPYMEHAKKCCSNMKIHASPWSPPAWLKDTKEMCNGGSLVDDPAYYEAYALYFVKMIQDYKAKGFDVARINVQNEPDVDPKYPSCIMPVEQMAKFIRSYLRPAFQKHGIETEIFAGTFRVINEATACDFLTVDEDIHNHIDGIGCQYSIMQPLYQIKENYPHLKLMHTESNCFNGANSWDEAVYLYMNIVNYLNAGCDIFSYWNMIIDAPSSNSWGWKQNSLITIDEDSKKVTYNPDYYIMTLLSKCVEVGSKRIVFASRKKNGIAFLQTDGSITFMASNLTMEESTGDVTIDGVTLDLTLAPMSITAFKIS